MIPNIMVQWCEICNNAPADGILEVLRTGETEIDIMHACQVCVDNLKPEDWIDNIDLQGDSP